MSTRPATKWAGQRLATFGLFVLAIIGGSNWDHDPNSWRLIALRLGATALFLSWAVRRTVGHYLEDQEGRMSSSRSISFWRDYDTRQPYVVATTKTEDPNAPIELIRPFGDGSGDEVLVSLTKAQWAQMVAFIGEHLEEDA